MAYCRKILFLCTFFVTIVSLFSCTKENSDANEIVYQISLETYWSSETYPDAYPANATLSPFVAFSHANFIALFDTLNVASPGLKALAEDGSINPLDQEIKEWIEVNNATDLVTSTRVLAPGTVSNQLTISANNAMVSLVAKVNPSPDWFVGVKNVNLYEEGEWINKAVFVDLYDAGTVTGNNFYDTPQTPRITPMTVNNISKENPLFDNENPFAIVRFERID